MKRTERFIYNASKKFKIQQELNDDVWGEDPELEEIDKCIEIATQLCSQNNEVTNEQSIMPSYSDFQQKQVSCSTQLSMAPPAQSTSKMAYRKQEITTANNNDISDWKYQKTLQEIDKLKLQNKLLTEKTEIKDGEISILRSQLKQSQIAVEKERVQILHLFNQNAQETNGKVHASSKEISSLKNDIDLKNLEIANLREQISESKRLPNGKSNLTCDSELTQHGNVMKKKMRLSYESTCKRAKHESVQTRNDTVTSATSNIYMPLYKNIPNTLFEICEADESYIQLNKSNNESALLFCHNSSHSQYDNIIKLKSTWNIHNKFSSVCFLYPEISFLMECNKNELNHVNITSKVHKIVSVTFKLISDMTKVLETIEKNMTLEDLKNMDALYLEREIENNKFCIFNGKSWCENEAGIDIRRCLGTVAELVFYNTCLYNYLTGVSPLKLSSEDGSFATNSKLIALKKQHSEPNDNKLITFYKPFEFLNILFKITSQIGKIRRSHQFPGLLSSILNLMAAFFHKDHLTTQCYFLVQSIFSEIIFSRPPSSVLTYVTKFLKYAAYHSDSVKNLCRNADSYTFKTDDKKEFFLFTNETCTFQILAVSLEGFEKNIEASYNFIQFLLNSVLFNPTEMYSYTDKRCECLPKLYGIAINMLYQSSEDYLLIKQNSKDKIHLSIYNDTFCNGILLINSLALRFPEMIVKYVRLYTRCKVFIHNMENLKDELDFRDEIDAALQSVILNFKSYVEKSELVKPISVKYSHLRKNILKFSNTS